MTDEADRLEDERHGRLAGPTSVVTSFSRFPLVRGEKIGPGLDLGLPGYGNLKKIPDSPHGLAGAGWLAIDTSNVNQYPF